MKSSWTQAEDAVVSEAVRRHGTSSWTRIARILHESGASTTYRDGKRCRSRYLNHISPAVNKAAWTEGEERAIYVGHSQLGNRWSEIARRLKGRTDNAVKNHWYSLTRRAVRAALKAHRVDHVVSEEDAKRLASAAAVRGLRGLVVAESREGRYEQMKEVCLDMLRKKAPMMKKPVGLPAPKRSRSRASSSSNSSAPWTVRRKIFSEDMIRVLASISGAEAEDMSQRTAYMLLSIPPSMRPRAITPPAANPVVDPAAGAAAPPPPLAVGASTAAAAAAAAVPKDRDSVNSGSTAVAA